MRINIKVIANAKQESIERLSQDHYRLRVCAPASRNLANKAVIELIAGHFRLKKGRIKIIKGVKSRTKVIELLNL